MSAPTPSPTVDGAANAHGTVASQGQNPWLQYFGPSNGPIVTQAYDKYAEENYDLPEAYRGKNLFLRDTIDGLITDGSQPVWYTTVALPWKSTDQLTIRWNEFHFNQTLAGRVPHEGVSRLVTSSRRQYAEKTVRRGLAMILEHGFMNTPEGKDMYKQNLLQIAQCVQETANHDVVSAYLTCSNYDKEWERKHGIKQDGVRRMMTEEVNRTGCVQKTVYGLDILIEDVKKRLARYGAKPDMMVIPQKMAIYMTMVRPEKTQYYLGGKVTEENIRQGPDAMTSFRGLNVFETRSFDVYEGEPPIDLLLRARQHGEYYTVTDQSNAPVDWSPDNLSLQVYDEDSDNWRRLALKQLIEGCVMIPDHVEGAPAHYIGSDGMRIAGIFSKDLEQALAVEREDSMLESNARRLDGRDDSRFNGPNLPQTPVDPGENLTNRHRKPDGSGGFTYDGNQAQDMRKPSFWDQELSKNDYTPGDDTGYEIYTALSSRFGAYQDRGRFSTFDAQGNNMQEADFDDEEQCHDFGRRIQLSSSENIKYYVYKLASSTSETERHGICFYTDPGLSITPPSAMYSCFFNLSVLPDEATNHALLAHETLIATDAKDFPRELLDSTCVFRRAVTVAELDQSVLSDEFIHRFVKRFATHARRIAQKIVGKTAKIDNVDRDPETTLMLDALGGDVRSVFLDKVMVLGRLLHDTTDETSISMANGFSRHPMHDCFLGNSYTGVSTIASVDKAERGSKAREILQIVNMIAGHDNFSVSHLEELTPNYAMSVDGITHVQRNPREKLLISTFNGLMGGVGHTVAGVDESGNYMAPSLPGDMCIALPNHLARLQSGGMTGSVLTNVSLGIGVGAPDLTQSIDQRDEDWHFKSGFSTAAILKMYQTMDMAGNGAVRGEANANAFVPNKRARTRAAASSVSSESENPMVSMFLENHVGTRHQVEPQGAKRRSTMTQRLGNEDGYLNIRPKTYDSIVVGDFKTRNMQNSPRSPNAEANVARLVSYLKGEIHDVGMLMLAGNTLSSYVLTKVSMQTKVNEGYPFPFEFLVFRPFIEHQCYSLVITKGGGETGATYYGHNNVTLGDDAVSKLHYANLTFYQKSIIHNPKNVYIAEDVYFTGYLGGNSMEMFRGKDDVAAGNKDITEGQVRYQKSMFVMLMQAEECATLRNPVSITGRFPEHIDKFEGDRMNFSHGQQYSSAAHAYAKFGLNILEGGGQNSGLINDVEPFTADVQTQNTICFQGAQWNYNDRASDYNIEVKNTGHLGPTYAGVRPVREGQHKHMEIPNAPRAPAANAQAPVYM